MGVKIQMFITSCWIFTIFRILRTLIIWLQSLCSLAMEAAALAQLQLSGSYPVCSCQAVIRQSLSGICQKGIRFMTWKCHLLRSLQDRKPFQSCFHKYCKVASSNTSRLEAHAGFFRLLMKGIFDLYVVCPFNKKSIS